MKKTEWKKNQKMIIILIEFQSTKHTRFDNKIVRVVIGIIDDKQTHNEIILVVLVWRVCLAACLATKYLLGCNNKPKKNKRITIIIQISA